MFVSGIVVAGVCVVHCTGAPKNNMVRVTVFLVCTVLVVLPTAVWHSSTHGVVCVWLIPYHGYWCV